MNPPRGLSLHWARLHQTLSSVRRQRSIGRLCAQFASTACCLLVVSGCSERRAGRFALRSVEPRQASASGATAIRVLGEGFAPAIRANFNDNDESVVSSLFSAQLGPQTLSLRYVDPETLTGTVAGGLAPGSYGLSVTDPRGQQATLPSAFVALSPDLGAADAGGPDGRVDGASDAAVAAVASTVAGSGVLGFADGPAQSARFDSPSGVAVAAGVIYVADRGNHRIRQIVNGEVTTVAGQDQAGFVDGAALSARLRFPDGLAVDVAGTLYIADVGNSAIRSLAGGTLSTVAGDGEAGLVEGAAATARFRNPAAVVVDGAKIYVADTGNHRIRVIEAGVVSTLAGSDEGFADAPLAGARFSSPSGLALIDGSLYVADTGNHRIRRISAGQVSTVAGTGTAGGRDGPALSSLLSSPTGVAGDGQRLYVADRGNHWLRVVADGMLQSLLFGPGFRDGPADTALLRSPRRLWLEQATNALLIVDEGNQRVRRVAF